MAWRIGEMLVQKKLITWEQLEEALEDQKKTKEFTGEILIRKGYISQSLLYKALAEQYRLRFVDLKRIKINPKAIELIPRNLAHKFSIIPIEIRDDVLLIGISNPLNVWPELELKQITKLNDIRTVLCLPGDIDDAIREYYGNDEAAVDKILRPNADNKPLSS